MQGADTHTATAVFLNVASTTLDTGHLQQEQPASPLPTYVSMPQYPKKNNLGYKCLL